MNRQTVRKRLLALPLLATFGLCASVPFNMGGCADSAGQLGNFVGSATGHPEIGGGLKAGGQLYDASVLNESDEKAMGESVAMRVAANHPIMMDAKQLNTYVTLVGLTLASVSPRPDGNWYFAVIDDSSSNAISGPDGYIMITRGAFAQMRDEAELAGVLAHEMTHVLNHHGLKAAKNAGVNAAGATAANTAMQKNDQLGLFSKGIDGTFDLLSKGYSRPQEDEADAGAVRLLVAAGYDPHSYAAFLGRIGSKGGLFSTHPGAADRVAHVNQEIAKAGNPTGATLADRYAKMTAGR